MSLREIITFPDTVLVSVADPVEKINHEIIVLLNDMAETMYANEGVGLAGNQVGVLKRVLVLDVSSAEPSTGLIKAINPEIVSSFGKVVREEGCLSLPDVKEEIERPESVVVKYTNESGEEIEMNCDGLLARAFQHEIDHLDGHLLLDHLSTLKRGLYKRKLKKAKKEKM